MIGRNFQRALELQQTCPNPYISETNIFIDVPHESQVLLEIYDTHGQPIKLLVSETLPVGRHQIEWDATDNWGNTVPSGIYFYRVSTDEFVNTRKMILM